MKRAAVFLLAALAGTRLGAQEEPIRVATLSSVLTEVAREVGGDRVAVTGIVLAGVDPHTFSPSPRDIRTMVDADLVLASGLNIEAYLDRLVASDIPTSRVVAVGDRLPSVILFPRLAGMPEKDPHWWNSVGNVVLAAGIVSAEFSRIRPGSAEVFAANLRTYTARLRALGRWAALEVGTLPPERRILVTSHDAFGYFARDYGFRLHAINGLSTDGEADARNVAALVDQIRRERIPAVFVESSVNPRLVENLVRETGVKLGGSLYADGLGPPGSGAQTYETMFRHNVETIVRSLSAPSARPRCHSGS
jgi:zinc/manganese transport system substrate-binding protein